METFLIIIISILVTLGIVTIYKQWRTKQVTNAQSLLLLDKVKRVCKFITVEGDFAEIYHYESVKEKFFKTMKGKKKALILIDAKAHVGFDLSKIKLESDKKNKKIILTQFPKPKLLTIETDFKYYDKKEGWLNPMTSNDLTEINQDAKQFIIDKIPESGLIESAGKELLTVISLMETVAESIGWTIDFSALELNNDPDQKLI